MILGPFIFVWNINVTIFCVSVVFIYVTYVKGAYTVLPKPSSGMQFDSTVMFELSRHKATICSQERDRYHSKAFGWKIAVVSLLLRGLDISVT